MTDEIDNFRLKIRNTISLKRRELKFGIAEAQLLDEEIAALQSHIEKLETELLQTKTMSVDIVGREF